MSLFESTKPKKVTEYTWKDGPNEEQTVRLGNWILVAGEIDLFFVNCIKNDGWYYAHNDNGIEISGSVYDIIEVHHDPMTVYNQPTIVY